MSHSIKFPNKLLTAEPQVLDPAVQAIVRENLGIPEGGGSGPGGITQFVPKWTIYQKLSDLKVECVATTAYDILKRAGCLVTFVGHLGLAEMARKAIMEGTFNSLGASREIAILSS